MPTNEELKDNVIRSYVDLQRIKNAPDKDKEIAYQEQILETRLQQLGVTDLEKLKQEWPGGENMPGNGEIIEGVKLTMIDKINE